MTSPLPIILGAGFIGSAKDPSSHYTTPAAAQEYISTYRAHGGKTIDTSRIYPNNAPGTSESILGETDFASWATLDTKVLCNPGDHSPENIAKSINGSLAALQIRKIHINYLHYPDRTSSLEGVCAAMAKGTADGKQEHWGISNYSIDEVKTMLSICKANGYPKPVVYEGNYNALARKAEDELLPLLRENGIAFYAYSPAAGGIFSKTSSRLSGSDGISQMYKQMFTGSPELKDAVATVHDLAEKNGISGHEVALRWVIYHSALDAKKGDAVIIGASSVKQLEETLTGTERGPLPDKIAKAVTDVWESAKATAPDYTPFLNDVKLPGKDA